MGKVDIRLFFGVEDDSCNSMGAIDLRLSVSCDVYACVDEYSKRVVAFKGGFLSKIWGHGCFCLVIVGMDA